ncbi:Stress response protein nst1 [Plenodomus lindquistii]|nr:Stress response protein nst1 [Plenodomus lindquistii]
MAQLSRAPAPPASTLPSNGAAAHDAAASAVNRKKQKRREKEAAKKAAQDPPAAAPASANNGVLSRPPALASTVAPQYADPELDDPPYDDDAEFYSDEDVEQYEHAYGSTNGMYQPGYGHAPMPSSSGKKARKKKRAPPTPAHLEYASRNLPRRSPAPAHAIMPKPKDRIWNTSTQEERERIREFWLSLGEDERKSLVKIEKEAVLRKMKEQQKHSCSCTVCGRKRTAIEEELEVLYDAYYEELEQYAYHQQDVATFLPQANHGFASSAPHPRPLMNTHPPPGHYQDDEDDDEYSDGEEEEDYSNSDISSEGDYSSEERSLPPPEASDFLRFGSSLQVKGGILTVADDLLKNDGKKFIEMMEQLAERRMQREEEAQFQTHPSMYRGHSGHNHDAPPPPEEEDFDDEGDEEEGYEDDDYEEDDEDEDDTMTEEQRMEEGRRMFQIFAARMFEQRVLQAYREKVAAERQQRLLEELAEEDVRKDAKEAKKAKEAQKRKERKDKLRQQKAEAQARKDAEIAAKEAELKAAEEKRLEEQRRKREEQRKKKEAERKAQEEEKQRKEAERLKRQQEERDRQQEAERKAREQKAQEKKLKDDAKRKEREEREAKEKEAREKKAHEDNMRKDRDVKAKADKDRIRKEEQAAAAAAQNAVAGRKASQPIAVALPPPQLLKQNSSTGFPSPHVTPAVPKAPTPNKPRQASQHDSHGSSPKTPQVASGTSKSTSPGSQTHNPIMPRSILTKPPMAQQQGPPHHNQPTSPLPPMGLPPGMSGPPGLGMGGMPPGLNGFPGQGPMMPSMMGQRPSIPFFPQPGSQNFRGFPPPGMHAPGTLPMGRGFPMDGPPGFSAPPGFPVPGHMPSAFGMNMPSHSRQRSGSFERLANVDSPIAAPQAQPIQRPAPIQRPSSVKPHDSNGSDMDDLANHLGSKALLDDEEDIPEPMERRTSVQQHNSLRGAPPLAPFGFADLPGSQYGSFGGPNNGNIWGTPPLQSFGGAHAWANSPTSNVFSNPFPMSNPRVHERGPNEPRLVWLRRMVCSACKNISGRVPSQDGYVEAAEVHHHIDLLKNPIEPAVSLEEIKEACDIIDTTSTNGGGSLEYKEVGGHISHIKFVDSQAPPPSLGEIGSPIPSHSVLAGGFGRPFPGLGPQGF